MNEIPDLARPILYRDVETGEVIKGGEDSPEADEMRAELAEKRKKRAAAYYADIESPQKQPKPLVTI